MSPGRHTCSHSVKNRATSAVFQHEGRITSQAASKGSFTTVYTLLDIYKSHTMSTQSTPRPYRP